MVKFVEEPEMGMKDSSERVVKKIFPSIKRKTDHILSLATDMDIFDPGKDHCLLQKTEYDLVKESILLSNMIRSAVTERGDDNIVATACEGIVNARVVAEGNIIHIILSELLPKRLKRDELRDVDMEMRTYGKAINDAFVQTPVSRFSEKVVLCFRHIYTSKKEMRDHDNMEMKAVIDTIAVNVLRDDGPMDCAYYIDYEMGEYKHTEIDVVPESKFAEYILIKMQRK